jgi:hypothetical protein
MKAAFDRTNSMKNKLKADWNRMVVELVSIPAGRQIHSLSLTQVAGYWVYARQHGQPVPVAQLRNAAVTKGYCILHDGANFRVALPPKRNGEPVKAAA